MRRVIVATKIFEEVHSEIPSMLIDMAHFDDAILGTSQSSGCGTLNDGTDICVTGIKYIRDRFEKLSSCNKVPYTPTGHRIGFGKCIDANNSSSIKFIMHEQRTRTDMYPLEKNFIITLI